MSIGKILIVENEEVLANQLQEPLRKLQCEVAVATCMSDAANCLRQAGCDLVISEVTLPDGSASDLIQQCQMHAPPAPVIVISDFGRVESAVECLRQGAFGYLFKPFSQAQVEVMLAKVEDHLRLVRLNHRLSHDSDAEEGWELLGESPAMRILRQTVRQVAHTDATVLISGEAGTGKRRVAHALCLQSPRAHAPLITVNCAGMSAERLEVELFGREKAVGTGAGQRQFGCFELAHRGTIVLDEISEISLETQARLLRVLQDQSVQRVGGSHPIPVDVRVLATTNRSLEDNVNHQQFREDLYLRLNIAPVFIPPLRERKSDIPVLAERFRQQFTRKHASSALAISTECIAAIQNYSWPGNVRELKNVIEHGIMACTAGNILEVFHLGSLIAAEPAKDVRPGSASPSTDEPEDLASIEKRHILAVLEKYKGNRTHAAKRLDISIRTLRNKLKEYRAEEIATESEEPVSDL